MWKRECYLHSLLCMSSRLEMSFSRYKVQDTRRKIITDLKMNYNSQKDLHAPGTLKYDTCSRKINWEWTFGKRRRESAFQAWADFCKSFFYLTFTWNNWSVTKPCYVTTPSDRLGRGVAKCPLSDFVLLCAFYPNAPFWKLNNVLDIRF